MHAQLMFVSGNIFRAKIWNSHESAGLYRALETQFRNEPVTVVGAGESLLDISFCGIFGSDMHAWHGHDERRVPPLVLGHEAVGRVVDGPLHGQLVAINPLMTCGSCSFCASGNTHLCAARDDWYAPAGRVCRTG